MAYRYATPLRFLTALPALALAAALLLLPRPAAAEEAPPLTYGIDVVSNYVWRGNDVFVSTFDKEGKKHEAFQFTPAAQPSITFNGPGGLALNLWGSFALTDRAEDTSKGFAGLKTLDEVDYTLSWGWDNKLGSFSAGLITYTITDVSAQWAGNELFFSVAPKFADAVGGSLTHYVTTDAGTGSTYTLLAIGGGEDLTWGLSLGQAVKLQDVTAKVGYAFGAFSVAFNVAYRPNPEILAGGLYDKDGKYLVGATQEDYPPAVAWITFSYGGEVAP